MSRRGLRSAVVLADGGALAPPARPRVTAVVLALTAALLCGLQGPGSEAPVSAAPSSAAQAATAAGPHAAADGTAATTPGCSLTATGGHVRRSVGGRSYLLYVPPGLTGQEAQGVPLLVALHGLTSSGAEMSSYTGFSPGRFVPPSEVDADQRGYVVAYLDGIGSTWDLRASSPDVTFVRQAIYQLRSSRCIDPTRVHVTGHSLGSMLAQRVACDLADVVASVTAYATNAPPALASCTPFRPISIGFFHGEQDDVLGIGLGRAARDRWIQRNGCSPTAIPVPTDDGTRLRWSGCDDGVEVTWHAYQNQGHLWPGNERRPDMVDEIWALYDAHAFPATDCLPLAFADVGGRHPFLESVCWLVGEGITTGWPDGTFRPSAGVSRQAMSAFLFRLSGASAPQGCTPEFPDVPADHPFFVEVCWMAQQDITRGYDDGTFRPLQPVRRDAMSAFLHRSEGEPPVALPEAPTFPDVAADHTFYEAVEWMADAEVSEGYDDGTFRPSAVVTRQAMSAFLERVAALP